MTREELRKKRKELAESKGYAGFIPYSQRQKQTQQQVQQPITQPTTQPVTQPINNTQFTQRVNELYQQNMQMTSLANTTRQLHTVNRSSNLGFASQYGGTNGNIDINNRKVKQNNDGSISTEKSITITETDEKGKERHVVIPTVIDGKRPDDDDEAARIAIEHYEKTGENLGKFSNLDDANKFAEDLSKRQGIYYDNKNTNPLLDNLKTDSTEPLKNITKKEAKKQIKESNKLVKKLKREEYDKVQEEEERKDTVIPKQDMTPTPTLQDRINKHYVENMQNLANTTMNMVTNTVKRNPIVNSFMAGFNTGKNVELPQNQVKTIQNAVKKDLQTNTQDKRNPYTIMQDKNNQKKEEEEGHKKDVSYKPYQLPQAQEMVNKNQQEVDERKKNEEAQGLLSQVQNRTLPQAQKQEEVKKPTLTESIEEYLRTGNIKKSAGNYFKSQFEGGKQGVLEYGQYYNETLPSKVEGDSWTKRKSEEQYKAKEYREGLLNDVKQNPNNYSKEQKSFIKNQQEFTEKYGDNFYEAYKNESKEKVNKMIEEAPTEIDRKLIEIGQSNGQSAVGAGFSMLSPMAGTMYFYGSSAQSYYDSALEMGMAESDAWKYANVMGAWETVSEELIAANRVDQVSKILTGSNIGKTGMKFLGNSMVENAFQEALSEPVDDITKSMLNYSYLNEGQLGERMLESGMIGAISALLMDSPTAVLSAPGDIVNLYNKSVEKIGKKATIEKMQKGAETYYAQILSEINNGLGNDAYEMMRNQNIQEENELSRLLPGEYENQQEIDRTRDEKLKAITEDMTEGDKTAYLIQNSNLSQEEKDSLSRVARRLNVSADQIDDLLKFNEEQKQIQSENNELEQMIDNSNLSQAQIGEVLSQKSFEEAKNKINELTEENNANQEAIKTLGLNISEENKEGNISYKEKQNIEINDSDTLESSYKKYFGENETTFVKRLKNLDKAAIESGQNVKIVFDAQYFKDNNGNLRTGTEAAFVNKDGKRIIAVNPYATTGKNFEQVLAHELTHAVLSEKNADTDMLYKTVEDYLKSKGEYDNIVKDLKGLYGDNYNEEEIVAKTIERIFDTKTELNDLANSQPNLFTRIYRNLVGLYAKITGSEKAYIKKLKLDMELAWKNSNNKGSLQDTIKNSITEMSETDSQGRKLTKEQQNFLKNTKAIDDNGNPIKLYHGTNQAGFSKVNNYLFLTTNREIAQDYAGGDKTYDPNNPNSDLTPIQTNGKNSYFKNVGEIKNSINEYTLGDLQAIWDFIDENNGFSDTIYDYDLENDLDKQIKNIDSSAVQDIVNATLEELNNWNSDDTIPIPSLSNEQVSDSNLYTENRKIYETYANIENPLEIDLQGGKVTNEMINNAKQEGYDGIIAHNTGEGRGNKKGDTYIVFNENQLIDANNDNIKYSIETDNNGNKNARFTEERLNDIIDNSVTEFTPGYAKNYITRITPQQFLDLTTTPEILERLKNESTELNEDELRDETQTPYLVVDMETGRVLGHEGRHRMIALQNAGVENVDIEIRPQEGTYNKENAEDFKYGLFLLGQSMGNGQKGKNVSFRNPMYAVNYNNIDKIKQEYLGKENKGDIRYSIEPTNKDSQGRTLSEQQQEFFKDSKVRDENGNLEVVYHQTKNDFTEFKNGFSIRGFKNANFFTNQKPKQILKNVLEGYVRINNPLYLENTSIQQNIVDEAIANGYDGIINQNVQGIEGKNEIVAFNSNQFKNIDNKKPTSNPDIRYSIEPTNKDSQGRTLSEQQQKYFKDSKVRDENGNLIPMYHSTNADFTVFDKEKLGDNTFYDNTAFGFFVTPNKAFSERFKDIDNKGIEGKTMEVYIDAKKPITHPYGAGYKYNSEELDKITREWLKATNNTEFLEELENYVAEGESNSIWDAYMDMTVGESPYESAEYDREALEEKGYDAVEFVEGVESNVVEGSKNNDPVSSYAVFNPEQIKNIDNTNPTSNPDIRYSIETEEFDRTLKEKFPTPATEDNHHQALAKGMADFMSNSKARSLINGGLVNVFHTTGDYSNIPQFNEFDPRGDEKYKFGNQIVNYFTDDKEMSGSYADQEYIMANTQKMTTLEEVEDFLNKNGDYTVEDLGEGAVIFNNNDREAFDIAQEFAETLTNREKNFLRDMLNTGSYDLYMEENPAVDENLKFAEDTYKLYEKFLNNHTLYTDYGKKFSKPLQSYLSDYLNGKGFQPVKQYTTNDEMFRNIVSDFQIGNGFKNTGAWQYSGYVNIQNPYVITAPNTTTDSHFGDAGSWQKVDFNIPEEYQRVIDNLSSIDYKELTNRLDETIKKAENEEQIVNSNYTSYANAYNKFMQNAGFHTQDLMKGLEEIYSDWIVDFARGDIENFDTLEISPSKATKVLLAINPGDANRSSADLEVFNKKYRQELLDLANKEIDYEGKKQKISDFITAMNNARDEQRQSYRNPNVYFEKYLKEDLLNGYSDDLIKEFSKALKEVYDSLKFSERTGESWTAENIQESILDNLRNNTESKSGSSSELGWLETNDIVKRVIDYNNSLFEDYDNNNELAEQYGLSRAETNKNRTPEEILAVGGYDGIIIRNVMDYGHRTDDMASHDLYITFGSNQFKSKDNKNPTLDKDIRYSEQTETADQILDRLLEKYRGKGERTYLPGIPKNLPKDYIMELGNKIEQLSIPDDKKLELYNLANTNNWNEESYNNFMTDLDAIEQDFKNQQQRDRFTTKSYDNPDRAKLITRKRNEFNKDYHYNDTLVDEIDSLLPRNSKGNRLVREWKKFARELGKRLALDNYTPDEIEDIAVKSYYDLLPTKHLTTYDKNSISKKAPREKLYANDWVNSVYEGLNEAGYDATKFSITDNGQNNEQVNQPALPQKELSTKLPVGQVNESKEDSLNAIREHHERELGDTINLEDIQNLPDLKGDKLEGDLPKTIDRIVDKRTKEKVTVKEFIKELKKQFVNKAYAVDKLAKQTGNKKLTHKYDRQLMAFNEAQVSLGDAQVNKDGRVVGKSLIETFKKAKDTGLDKVFADYLENKNNIARDKLGESLYGADVTAVQSRKIVEEYEKKYPQFKEWANDVSKYNDNLAESYLVGSFINQELWNKLKQLNPDYVPAFRDIVETKGLSDSVDNVGFQVLKRAEGGSSKILTPKEAMAEQTVNYVKAYRKNETIKELYKTIKGKLDSTDILYEDMETVPEIAYEMMREAVGKDQDGHYTATFFENGKATSFKVGKDIFDAFVQGKGIEAIEKNAITKVLGGTTRNIAQFQRNAVTTYSIPFLLKNMVRDYNDALINTQYSDLRFMKNYARAYIEMITKGKYYEQYKNAGGGANTYYDYEKGLLPGSTKNPLKKFINKVVSLNEYIETAPRLAEFISTMEKGGNLDEALYNAAEITTNFKRGGDTAKLINKYGANFFNASIQGADKVIRNITGQKGLKGYANLAVKTMIAGVAPSLLNHILISGSDDPEERKAYEELQDYIKNNYYLIYKGNGDFYRIPKGRIAGTIGAAAVGLYRTTQGEDDAFDGYFKNVLLENLAPNNPLTNNIIAPVLQAKKNDAWYDGTIYSETKYANKLPMEVTDEKVDDFSNLVAKGVNALFDDETLMKSKTNNGWLDILANPKKLNYVLDQYSGGFGDIVLPQLTPRAENNFIADQFTTSSVLKNKYVGEFYDMCDNNIGNSEYATDFDKLTYKYLNNMSKEVGGLYKEKHEIEQSDLPDEEKMKQSREKQKEINELCKEAVETVKGTKVTGNTAEFGGQTYYKDNEDEWKKVSEDSEMNMLYTVDATTYADWKNKTTAANKAKKESEGKGLTDKEKDAMLVNSTYRDEEKEAIYMDSMGKDDDVYKALKIIAQPDIDEYLTYQSQTFESDRVDDGTAKGKAVTKGEGTSKNKTINYLDNSNMSSAETEYIKATKYKLDSTAALRNYIDSLNLSEEDYRTVMSNIKDSNVVELSDGTWKWK